MKTLLTVAAITLALAGCAQRPQPTVAEECAAYGFTAGTESFANCQMYVTQARMSRGSNMVYGGRGSSKTCMDAAGAAISCY